MIIIGYANEKLAIFLKDSPFFNLHHNVLEPDCEAISGKNAKFPKTA